MSGHPASGLRAPSAPLGVLRSWLSAWSSGAEQPPPPRPVEPEWPTGHRYGAVRVLVVDDNPVNLILILAQMESQGLVPLLAADGAEAVALAREVQFDLILMDLQMPVLDGLAATAAIRRYEAVHSLPTVPIVAFSSACPGADLLARHGINGSLKKPCDIQDLKACLLQWCPGFSPANALRSATLDGITRQPNRQAGRMRSALFR